MLGVIFLIKLLNYAVCLFHLVPPYNQRLADTTRLSWLGMEPVVMKQSKADRSHVIFNSLKKSTRKQILEQKFSPER